MEKAVQLNLDKITESVIDEAIKQTYPGLRVRGSIMEVPISEFLTIRKDWTENNEENLKEAVDNLTNFAHEMGNICKLEKQSLPLDFVYQDNLGSKVGVAIFANGTRVDNLDELSKISRSAIVDRLVILTNKKIQIPYNATVVNVDKSKIIDLIYFNKKYSCKKMTKDDDDRVDLLARTLSII